MSDSSITDLQMRAMHLERHVESLDEVVREQFARIERLERELASLRERLASGGEEGAAPDGADEPPPPHY